MGEIPPPIFFLTKIFAFFRDRVRVRVWGGCGRGWGGGVGETPPPPKNFLKNLIFFAFFRDRVRVRVWWGVGGGGGRVGERGGLRGLGCSFVLALILMFLQSCTSIS